MNLRKLWAAAVIALLPVTLIAQDSGTRLDGSARRLDASPVSASSGGLTNGRVALSNGSTQVTDDAGLTYNKTTDVLTSGAVTAKNLTATALATPVISAVTPTLSQIGSITTIAAGWRANGLLTVVAGSALLDGETFVLSDGTHVPQSFEFDVANDGVIGGHVEIDIAGTETPAEVGALCAAAIDATTSATFTYDAIDNLDGTVALWNTTWAAAGNTAQSETVADAGFVVTNMTGGVDAGIIDGDYLTIKYSLAGTVPLEFDTGDGTTGGRIPVLFTGTETADDIRDLLITALNAAAPTQLTASSGGAATVALVLDTPGAVGDTNTENVGDAAFAVAGFVDPTHATTYGYKVEACLADGSCAPSAEVQTTTGHATLSNANYNSVTWGAVTGASYYKLTRVTGTPAGGDAPPRLLYTGPLLNFNDTNATSTSEAVATVNETGITTTGRVLVGDGSPAAPSVARYASDATGWFFAPYSVYFSDDGTPVFSLTHNNALTISSGLMFGFGNAATGGVTAGITSPVPATLQLGKAANATPVANTLIVGESGAGTDIPGANGVIQSGAGTGFGAGSSLIFKTPTGVGVATDPQTQESRLELSRYYASFSVSLTPNPNDGRALGDPIAQWSSAYLSRATLGSKSKALTDATPTAFATIALADGGETGGKLTYRVVATDGGTARQVVSGSINYAAVHVGATYAVDYDEIQQSTAVSTGTLTGAVTAAAASNLLTFSANFDTDLGTPVLTIHYRFDSTNAADSISPL